MAKQRIKLPPYQAGAGQLPPKIAGRENVEIEFDEALQLRAQARPSNPGMIVGARGLGKTVLLTAFESSAEQWDWAATKVEITGSAGIETQILAALSALVDELKPGKALLQKLANVVHTTTTFTLTDDGRITWALELQGQRRPPADQRGKDLRTVLDGVAKVAQDKGKVGVVLLVDELHEAPTSELESFAVALHELSQGATVPAVHVVCAGLPQLARNFAEARTYSERMFKRTELTMLSRDDVDEALNEPARAAGRSYTPAAIDRIYDRTEGYPFFVQVWGLHTWRHTANDEIDLSDVDAAEHYVVNDLDGSFFEIRNSTLTPRELEYLKALAQLPPTGRTSGDVAKSLNKTTAACSPIRDALINKGVVRAAGHGKLAFTISAHADQLNRAAAAVNRAVQAVRLTP